MQWSGLSLEDCLMRQGRYAADGVRGCWFFRHPPRELMRRSPSAESGKRLTARSDLPLFQLLGAANRTFQVALNGQRYGMEAFVYALLTRQIRFCQQATADEITLQAALIALECPGCRGMMTLWQTRSQVSAHCGVLVDVRDPELEARLTFHPAVIAAANRAVNRRAQLASAQSGAFACPHCGSISEPEALRMALYGSHMLAQAYATDGFQIKVSLETTLHFPFAHWCFPPDAHFCDS